MKASFFIGFRRIALAAVVGLVAILPSPAQPLLEIHRPSAATFEFRWSGAATSFSLEAANPLATPTDWKTLFETPVLFNGMFSLTLPAAVDSRFYRLRSTATGIESISPANRETAVAVDRVTVIRFNGFVEPDSLLGGDGIVVEHSGVRLPIAVELSPEDGQTVIVTYPGELPGTARIRVTVNGALLRDSNDLLVDANGDGLPGGVRVVEFETVDNRPPDTDDDGLDDPTEVGLGTDPALWDTDGDGFSDGQEQGAATDPLSLDSRPGIRLPDAPDIIADLMATFPSYGPFAVGPEAIAADGRILNRIAAVLNPQATPATVNEALDAAGLRIVTMYPGIPFVTLALPPRAGAAYSPAEINGIAQQLVVNSDLMPFLSARRTFEARPLLNPGPKDSEATKNLRPHDRIRMPAAWNLLASTSAPPAGPVRVLVPDIYSTANKHPQIWSQSFIASPGGITANTNGNHGFAVAGAIAGEFDDVLPTGTYPNRLEDPTERLKILSMPVGRLSWEDTVHAIVNAIIAQQPDIVSTSSGFLPPAEETDYFTRAERIALAFLWRARVLASGRSFLHIAAAGNDLGNPNAIPSYDREAVFSSPWNLAARRGNLDHMTLGATEITAAERFELQSIVGALPPILRLDEPLDNVVIVGSVDSDGGRSSFSEPGEDVLVQGSGLSLACRVVFDGAGEACDGTIWEGAAGTSYAAPQVAGVAAYLLTQKPGLSPTQLRNALLNTRAGDVLDAYRAVLELDAGDNALPLRRRLLDVAGGGALDATGVWPDGKFDEKDLEAFVKAFRDAEAEVLVDPAAPPDRSRFDLNGDGFTGGLGKARFDLDAKDGLGSVVVYLGQSVLDVDETAVTDREACCYFAYSPMYEGSPSERGRLLGSECPLPPMLAFRYQDGTGNGISTVTSERGTFGYGAYDPINPISYGLPVWSPSGSELAYSGRDAITIVRIGRALAEESPFAVLVPSPAGRASHAAPVYFARKAAGGEELYFQRVFAGTSQTWISTASATGVSRQLTSFAVGEGVIFPYGLGSQQGTVSPNNEWAFVYTRGDRTRSLRTITPEGVQRDLTPNVTDGGVNTAYWSPDGGSLAYISGNISGNKLQLLSNATLGIRTLATDAGSYRVSWSPDGRYLAYITGDGRNIRAVDLQGGPTLLLVTGTFLSNPAWSPDGKEIAFVRDEDLWVRTLATDAERRLTFTPQASKEGVVWRPGSKTEP